MAQYIKPPALRPEYGGMSDQELHNMFCEMAKGEVRALNHARDKGDKYLEHHCVVKLADLYARYRAQFFFIREVETSQFMNLLNDAIPSQCPPKGTGFYAYKLVKITFVPSQKEDTWTLKSHDDINAKPFMGYPKPRQTRCPAIAKLWIPEDAERSSAFYAKCRCSKALVEDITISYGGKYVRHVKCGDSPVWTRDDKITYRVGETYSVENFDMNRFEECSAGVHFFMSEAAAMEYAMMVFTKDWVYPVDWMTAKIKEEEETPQ